MALSPLGQRVEGNVRITVVADLMPGRGYFLDGTRITISRQSGDEKCGSEPLPLKELEDAGNANFWTVGLVAHRRKPPRVGRTHREDGGLRVNVERESEPTLVAGRPTRPPHGRIRAPDGGPHKRTASTGSRCFST